MGSPQISQSPLDHLMLSHLLISHQLKNQLMMCKKSPSLLEELEEEKKPGFIISVSSGLETVFLFLWLLIQSTSEIRTCSDFGQIKLIRLSNRSDSKTSETEQKHSDFEPLLTKPSCGNGT